MPDFGNNDPLSAAVRGRGGLYNLSTATQPGQGALDRGPQSGTNPMQDRSYLIANLAQYDRAHGITRTRPST